MYDTVQSLFRDMPKFEQMFRDGRGLGWGEHDGCLFSGTARFFRPNYAGNIVANWIPLWTASATGLPPVRWWPTSGAATGIRRC